MGGGRSRGATSIGGSGGLDTAGGECRASRSVDSGCTGGAVGGTEMELISCDVAGGLLPGGGRIPVDDIFGSRSVPYEEAVVGMRIELHWVF